MNLRVFKKDIEYFVGEFIDDCLLFEALNPNKDTEAITEIIEQAVELYNDLKYKANHPGEGKKRAYYNNLREEMFEKIDELAEQLSDVITGKKVAKAPKKTTEKKETKVEKAPAKEVKKTEEPKEEKPKAEKVEKAPAKATKKTEEVKEKKVPTKEEKPAKEAKKEEKPKAEKVKKTPAKAEPKAKEEKAPAKETKKAPAKKADEAKEAK